MNRSHVCIVIQIEEEEGSCRELINVYRHCSFSFVD